MSERDLTHRDVLLVDDDAPTRKLFEHVLSRIGLTVVTANDGQEAFDLLATYRVDAVVLDLMMPRMDGFEVMQRLAAEGSGLLERTVVLSAASVRMIAKANDFPVWAALRKPVDINELVETVLDCVSAPRSSEDRTRKPPRAVTRPASLRATG